jgi:DNA-binding CsgD family transcriptional regulator
MIRESALLRTSHKITAYIEKYVTLVGAEKREEVIGLFENMHQLFPQWVLMTCPVMHPDIHYQSKNCPYVFGYKNDYFMNNSSPEKYFTHVHSADQDDLYECISFLHNFLETIPPDDHHAYRAIFHYRFKKANGPFMYLHDEKATLYLKGSGNLYYGLFRDVTDEKTFSGVKVELFYQEQYPVKIKEHKPAAQRNPLSKREKELVTLIKQGLSTKEIAGYLNISHNTVRNIKSKLFEKYNVGNSIELLNMAG